MKTSTADRKSAAQVDGTYSSTGKWCDAFIFINSGPGATSGDTLVWHLACDGELFDTLPAFPACL